MCLPNTVSDSTGRPIGIKLSTSRCEKVPHIADSELVVTPLGVVLHVYNR
jgi:hypothetical protein